MRKTGDHTKSRPSCSASERNRIARSETPANTLARPPILSTASTIAAPYAAQGSMLSPPSPRISSSSRRIAPMSSPVVTRFAPSPTGFLHIGGGRTALFNWLYSKHHGGRMLLRIEDTDRQRSTQEAVDAILDGLKWLGLDWDGEPISQTSRVARHRETAEALLASGHA